jgi:hypothetical protein
MLGAIKELLRAIVATKATTATAIKANKAAKTAIVISVSKALIVSTKPQ